MIEYLPWSKQTLQEVFSYYSTGFRILDIQLGGGCNFSCIYCDTPERTTKSKVSIKWLEKIVNENPISWIYICGLGEPTFGQNIIQLKAILKICKQYKIKCSMFTNYSLIDDEIKSYIKDSILYILFKFDTNSVSLAKELFGDNNLDCYFNNISKISELVQVTENCTNIAASIVPTQKNKEELLRITEFCIDKNIFPLIGDLEDSGKSISNFKALKINDKELSYIKSEIETKLQIKYQIPICPSVIGGIHIDYNNNVIVDGFTGLSCHWFWLKEPKVKVLVNDVEKYQFEEIVQSIKTYRNSRIDCIKQFIEHLNNMPFGGCGGDVKTMLTEYLKLYNADRPCAF